MFWARDQTDIHDLRTTFQSLALHDTLTFAAARDGFEIECDDPRCPTGRANLVWRAAALMWRAAGRAGDPAGVRVRLEKRIPAQAGLGGGSSDALATLRALGTLWRVKVDDDRLLPMAVNLGADVPFFLEGGAALGVERGDGLLPLADLPRLWVVLVVPNFGVSTEEAYAWFDRNVGSSARPVQSGGGRVPERRTRRVAVVACTRARQRSSGAGRRASSQDRPYRPWPRTPRRFVRRDVGKRLSRLRPLRCASNGRDGGTRACGQ